MLRHVPLGNMYNLRDLGGYSAAGGRETVFGRLFRGDNPSGLSEGELVWLRERGVSTIIDLRSAEELLRAPDQLSQAEGFHYLHIPLAGLAQLPGREEDMGLGYFQAMDRKDGVRAVFEAVAAAEDGVLYHCAAGKDRTGVISALLLSLVGVGLCDILADYEVSETYLWEMVSRMRAEYPGMPAFWGASKREYLWRCMDLTAERYGSMTGYLHALDLPEGTLERIKSRLLGG